MAPTSELERISMRLNARRINKYLYIVPVLIASKRRKLLARLLPPPQEVISHNAHRTKTNVSMPQQAGLFNPPILIGLPFAHDVEEVRR